MNNLPDFPGASVVYSRASMIAAHLNAQEYDAQRKKVKGRKFKFSPNRDASILIDAMNRGDEDVLKAMNYRFRDVWL